MSDGRLLPRNSLHASSIYLHNAICTFLLFTHLVSVAFAWATANCWCKRAEAFANYRLPNRSYAENGTNAARMDFLFFIIYISNCRTVNKHVVHYFLWIIRSIVCLRCAQTQNVFAFEQTRKTWNETKRQTKMFILPVYWRQRPIRWRIHDAFRLPPDFPVHSTIQMSPNFRPNLNHINALPAENKNWIFHYSFAVICKLMLF